MGRIGHFNAQSLSNVFFTKQNIASHISSLVNVLACQKALCCRSLRERKRDYDVKQRKTFQLLPIVVFFQARQNNYTNVQHDSILSMERKNLDVIRNLKMIPNVVIFKHHTIIEKIKIPPYNHTRQTTSSVVVTLTCLVNSVIRALLTRDAYSFLSPGITTLPSPAGSSSTRRPSLSTVEKVHSSPQLLLYNSSSRASSSSALQNIITNKTAAH